MEKRTLQWICPLHLCLMLNIWRQCGNTKYLSNIRGHKSCIEKCLLSAYFPFIHCFMLEVCFSFEGCYFGVRCICSACLVSDTQQGDSWMRHCRRRWRLAQIVWQLHPSFPCCCGLFHVGWPACDGTPCPKSAKMEPTWGKCLLAFQWQLVFNS